MFPLIKRMKAQTRKQRFRQLQAVVNQGLNACIIELAQEYLQDFPKHGVVWLYYGNALADFAMFKEARVAFLKAIKYMKPEHLSFPYNYMGHLYEIQGDYRRAAEWHEKAHEANPITADHLNFLGAALSHIGKLSEAESCFRKAIKCKEGMIDESYYNLGVILAGQGKYKQALDCLEKALEFDPQYKLAKQAIKDMRKVLTIKDTSNVLRICTARRDEERTVNRGSRRAIRC